MSCRCSSTALPAGASPPSDCVWQLAKTGARGVALEADMQGVQGRRVHCAVDVVHAPIDMSSFAKPPPPSFFFSKSEMVSELN